MIGSNGIQNDIKKVSQWVKTFEGNGHKDNTDSIKLFAGLIERFQNEIIEKYNLRVPKDVSKLIYEIITNKRDVSREISDPKIVTDYMRSLVDNKLYFSNNQDSQPDLTLSNVKNSISQLLAKFKTNGQLDQKGVEELQGLYSIITEERHGVKIHEFNKRLLKLTLDEMKKGTVYNEDSTRFSSITCHMQNVLNKLDEGISQPASKPHTSRSSNGTNVDEAPSFNKVSTSTPKRYPSSESVNSNMSNSTTPEAINLRTFGPIQRELMKKFGIIPQSSNGTSVDKAPSFNKVSTSTPKRYPSSESVKSNDSGISLGISTSSNELDQTIPQSARKATVTHYPSSGSVNSNMSNSTTPKAINLRTFGPIQRELMKKFGIIPQSSNGTSVDEAPSFNKVSTSTPKRYPSSESVKSNDSGISSCSGGLSPVRDSITHKGSRCEPQVQNASPRHTRNIVACSITRNYNTNRKPDASANKANNKAKSPDTNLNKPNTRNVLRLVDLFEGM